MATRNILTPKDWTTAKRVLRKELRQAGGISTGALRFSAWLEKRVLETLSDHPSFWKSKPIATGSFGRGELCPDSDVDILFLGPEKTVQRLVEHFERRQIKLSYRIPENINDWTQGVDIPDTVSLMSARALRTEEDHRVLIEQEKIIKRPVMARKQMVRQLLAERTQRAQRPHNEARIIECNLKSALGGIRDLEQLKFFWRLFPNLREAVSPSLSLRIEGFRRTIIRVRQALHLNSKQTEILSAHESQTVAEFMQTSPIVLHKHLQEAMDGVDFLIHLFVERLFHSPRKKAKKEELVKAERIIPACRLIDEDPSYVSQWRIWQNESTWQSQKLSRPERRRAFLYFARWLMDFQDKTRLFAFFRSRLAEKLVTGYHNAYGLVQHDHYHRFPVDYHTMIFLFEIKKIITNPKGLYSLQKICSLMNNRDWRYILLAGLYHDLGKGFKKDHSTVGASFLRMDLASVGVGGRTIQEVEWLIKEHLTLSQFAFRHNPQSLKVHEELKKRGFTPARRRRLGIFTAIDILATNRSSWTAWKAQLINDLLNALDNPLVDRRLSVKERLSHYITSRTASLIVDQLSAQMVQEIPQRFLVSDIVNVYSGKKIGAQASCRVLLVNDRVWVRFHSNKDRQFIFLRLVAYLMSMGLSVRQAAIHTSPTLGVYDWFEVKTRLNVKQLRKVLCFPESKILSKPSFKRIEFKDVELENVQAQEWVFRFFGYDKKGVLLEAARRLSENNLQIQWARIYTWGRGVDDVFSVKPIPGMKPTDILDTLRKGVESDVFK